MVSNISGHDFFHSFFERVKIANVLLTFLFFVFVVIFCFFLSTPPKQFLIFYSLFVFCFSYFCIYFIIVCSKSFLLSFFFFRKDWTLSLFIYKKQKQNSFFRLTFQVLIPSNNEVSLPNSVPRIIAISKHIIVVVSRLWPFFYLQQNNAKMSTRQRKKRD